jgi:hypothetical protein
MNAQPILLALLAVLLPGSARAQGIVYAFAELEDACVGLGDLDGDGHPELALGHAGTGAEVGRISIRSGRTGAELLSVVATTPGDGFGLALARVGDLDGDGHDDLAVGVPTGAAPRVELISSASGSLQATLLPAVAGEFGALLASGGDADGDGVRDLLVGSPTPLAGGAGGFVEVVSLAGGTTLRTHVALDVAALAFLGDVDGDGRDDYALGIPGSTVAGPGPGRVEVVSGSSGAILRTLSGSFPYHRLGAALAAVGDIDGDGVGDLLVGAPGEPIAAYTTGAAYVVSGASGARLQRLVRPGAYYPVGYGSSLAGVEDYDGDGVPDLAVMHASSWAGGVIKNFGQVHVWSGSDGALLETMSIWGNYGPLATAGDVNLDGVQDLLVASAVTAQDQQSVLLLGQAPPPATFCSPKPTSWGCLPGWVWRGASSLSIGDELTVRAVDLRPGSVAGLLWSRAPDSAPFAGGTLCIAQPFVRAHVAGSGGGTGLCSGSLAFTFARPYLAANALTAGDEVFVQAWVRDAGYAPPDALAMTDGLRFTLWP